MKSESPMAATRVSGFFGSSSGFFVFGCERGLGRCRWYCSRHAD